MDVDSYLPMFLAEVREHLQELNSAVIKIEKNANDTETLDEIFRIAHTLKGMSATMGYENMAALTHRMEDVFEVRRTSNEPLEAAAGDVLLACLDELGRAADQIEANGSEPPANTDLMAKLETLAGTGSSAARATATAAPEPAAGNGSTSAQALLVKIDLAADVDMPAVRALLLLNQLAAHGDVLSSTPSAAEIDTFTGRKVEALVAGVDAKALRAALGNESGVKKVTVSKPKEQPLAAPPAPTAVSVARQTLHAMLDLGADPEMPAVRALLIVQALKEIGTVVSTVPADIEALTGRHFEVVMTGTTAEAFASKAKAAGATEVKFEAQATATATPTAQAAADSAAADRPAGKKTQTVRVDADRLDLLMHLMGEVLVDRTRLETLVASRRDAELEQATEQLRRSSQSLQSMVMQVRMVPVEAVFARFPRLVRDLQGRLGKQVELVVIGSETELDRTVVEQLADPLVHLIRNALDHGLETPDERAAAGKPTAGRLEISARHAGGSVLISVVDDGRGVNPQRVAAKAAERGLIDHDAAESVTQEQAVELLFHPGFSTADEMTDISGRGVGMDAVRVMIRDLGGDVSMTSQYGVGTRVDVRLPLTLAIINTLMVKAGTVPLAVPLDRVERTVRLRDHVVRSTGGTRMVILGEHALPMIDLGASVGYPPDDHAEFGVVIQGADRKLVASVSSLIGQTELVTRPLPDIARENLALAGGGVLANGEIAVIVDADSLVRGAFTNNA